MTLPNIEPASFEEMLAHIEGEDLGEFRRRQAERADLWAEAQEYMELPPSQWPPLLFNWDLTPEGQRFALDGVKPDAFLEQYPQGFAVGWVALAEFDRVLCHFSRRDTEAELWQLGFSSSLASVLAYLRRGLPITPPLVRPLDSREVILQGGHHRYAAAKASSLEQLPILALKENCAAISAIVRVGWADA
jgi:hypothetical protein